MFFSKLSSLVTGAFLLVGSAATQPRHTTRLSSSASSSVAFLLPRGGDNSHDNLKGKDFEILDEKVVYSRWRTVLQRKVKMRNGKIVDFDLVGTSTAASAVLVFAWDSKTKTATLIKEYMPGCNKRLYGIAAGLVEEKHGERPEVAAEHELEEEMHLRGGRWIPLTIKSTCMDKYATTMIDAFLVIDPVPEPNPKPLDEEEDIEIVSKVSVPAILDMISNGEMNLVGGWACMLAIQTLRKMGEIS
jgi:hypothetical protein